MKTNQKVFHVLDLDRTLLDTSKLAHNLKEIIARHNPELADAIHDEAIRHMNEKSSFFIFDYIANAVGELQFGQYMDELQQINPSLELLLPGALERIAYAKSQPGWAMGIMTYGADRDQMIKLKLLNLQFENLLIMDSPHKGEVIASWKLPDGRFKLPDEFGGHVVDIVTLDDDKHIAFDHLPDGVYGQWIAHASLGGMTELQSVSENVRVVPDLYASIAYLKTKLR